MLNRDDFTYTYTVNGYEVFYKGKSLGGAGVLLPRQKPLHWRHARANLKLFREDAERKINHLMENGI
jgi:hypothetical protein